MDESFPIDLLRNVQPTDRTLSVSKEFVGPKNRDERNRKKSHNNAIAKGTEAKPIKLYGRDVPSGGGTGEEGTTIDITI